MDGDFKGDFTRDTFYKLNHFSRVLMQQGRVQLDADWNEQVDILLYHLRTLTMDLIGPRAVRGDDFKVTVQSGHALPNLPRGTKAKTSTSVADSSPSSTVKIGRGHYYIDGILVENDKDDFYHTFDVQSDLTYLVYLDVWERQSTYIENKSIREVALGTLGPDTATRAMVVWQVKVRSTMPDGTLIPNPIPGPEGTPNQCIDHLDTYWELKWISAIESPYRGKLKARASEVSKQDTTPCIISPESHFRGTENQLYRVEIHKGGTAGEGGATFKWSRENGSVVFPISNLASKVVTLDTLGRDKRFGLKPDDWVEIIDDDYYLQDSPNPLVQVDSVDTTNMQVILRSASGSSIGQNQAKHPFLRRWDQYAGEQSNGDTVKLSEGAIVIEEGKWITLEDNVQIWFEGTDPQALISPAYPITYRIGDYWLIPARIATSNVEWPVDDKSSLPIAQDPHGVEHHYAPLAFVFFTSNKSGQICDLRRTLKQLWDGPAGCQTT